MASSGCAAQDRGEVRANGKRSLSGAEKLGVVLFRGSSLAKSAGHSAEGPHFSAMSSLPVFQRVRSICFPTEKAAERANARPPPTPPRDQPQRGRRLSGSRKTKTTVKQGIVVTIRRSKTDQLGLGRKIGIPQARGRHCPVAALDQWRSSSRGLRCKGHRYLNRASAALAASTGFSNRGTCRHAVGRSEAL